MTATQLFSGSETVSITEWDLTTDTAGPDVNTTGNPVQLRLDLSALAAGDIFELKFYEKVLSGSTQRVVDSVRFSGVQSKPNFYYPAVIVQHGWTFTLKKISGTDRNIDWSIFTSP